MKHNAEPVVGRAENSQSKAVKAIRGNLKVIIPVGLLVVAAIIGVAVYINSNRIVSNGLACTTGQGADLLRQASTELAPNDSTKLTQTSYKILALNSYQEDPSCLYILTTMEVNIGNKPDAENYLNQFNKVYNGSNVSSKLTSYKNISELRKEVPNFQPQINGIP